MRDLLHRFRRKPDAKTARVLLREATRHADLGIAREAEALLLEPKLQPGTPFRLPFYRPQPGLHHDVAQAIGNAGCSPDGGHWFLERDLIWDGNSERQGVLWDPVEPDCVLYLEDEDYTAVGLVSTFSRNGRYLLVTSWDAHAPMSVFLREHGHVTHLETLEGRLVKHRVAVVLALSPVSPGVLAGSGCRPLPVKGTMCAGTSFHRRPPVKGAMPAGDVQAGSSLGLGLMGVRSLCSLALSRVAVAWPCPQHPPASSPGVGAGGWVWYAGTSFHRLPCR